MLLSLLGFVAAPLLYPQNLERKITFVALAIIALYTDVVLSGWLVWTVFGFVD
jgi:hypothetical protein